jgi:hypothetical protein
MEDLMKFLVVKVEMDEAENERRRRERKLCWRRK